MSHNAAPKLQQKSAEKAVVQEENLADQVEVIKGILGKLRARQEAVNDAHSNDYKHPRTAADLIDWPKPS